MKNVILDTNVFIRLFLDDIPTQTKAVEQLFQEAKEKKKKLLVPQIVLFEIAFTLEKYYGFPKQIVLEKLKAIIVAEYLSIQNREVFKKAITLFTGQSISLADCFVLCYAIQREGEFFSFDRKLLSLYKQQSRV